MSEALAQLADAAALRRTAELYAQGADRRDKALWRIVLAQDCVIEGPGFSIAGREANLGSIDQLESMFAGTRHLVHNQVALVNGDEASGETYSTAQHLLRDGQVLVWHLRYEDRWRREEDGQWRFTRRTLILDWEETRSAAPGAAGA